MPTTHRATHICVHGLVIALAFLAGACGADDDDKAATLAADDNAGGEGPAVAPSYPPALGPADCATKTSGVTLSQPKGAAVWGGLVLLEFQVDAAEGAKRPSVSSFDVQAFDPTLGAWTSSYVGAQVSGQRDDGSYFMAVTTSFTEANKDQELKFRIRPSKQGCPDAEWTETDTFTAGDPLVGTKWKAALPGDFFSGQLTVQRNPIPFVESLSASRLALGDATVDIEFGKKGSFSEIVTVSLRADKAAPYADCTLSLGFSGTYALSLRQQYGGLLLAISDQALTSVEGTTCAFPAVADMSLSAHDTMLRLNAFTQSVSIDYLPTLYSEPSGPVWDNTGLAQVFQQLPQFLTYVTKTESGSVNGYVYPQQATFEKQ